MTRLFKKNPWQTCLFARVYKTKKEASANSGGTVIIALAGGGNQSFLTDGDLQVRGNDLRRTLLKKHPFLRHLFPSHRRFLYLSILSPILLQSNTLEKNFVRKSDAFVKNNSKKTGIESFFFWNYYNCGTNVQILTAFPPTEILLTIWSKIRRRCQ
jgi:hypothetical protein